MCDLCGGTTFCQLNVCSDCKSNINNKEQNFNSLQQLKAEIAGYANALERELANGLRTKHEFIIGRLRQLSAV